MYRILWKNRNVRFYLLGGSISRLGDSLAAMAFLFLAHDLTGSAAHTTAMAVAETAPYLLFGLIGGAVADALPKKKLLIILDLLRIPLVASILLLHYADALSFGVLLIISFLLQSIGCFFNPAHRAVLPMITKEEERSAANSLYDTMTRGVTIGTPLLSIVIIETMGVVHFFSLDALTYVWSVLCLAQIIMVEKRSTKFSIRSIAPSVGSFLKWAGRMPTIRSLFFFTFYTVFMNTWVWQVGLLLALMEAGPDGELWYSGIQGVFGAVVIITNLLAPLFIQKWGLHHYVIGAAVWGTGILYYGAFYKPEQFVIGTILIGIGIPVASLSRVCLLQKYVPESKMGRAFSTNAVLLYAANTISLAFFGLLSTFLSIQTLMIISGCCIIFLCVASWLGKGVPFTKLRRRLMINTSK
ncbi:MFS transporter [Halobacillus sp. BAB-2008]|uniref:MFS transporter n=1 Tax=Halobacillus sp. BAB-2008 TaxID=1246484 RepID=UPI0002A4E6CE|nr:MFS transporter [Halobacillus sp. BAB-2008]ELK46938.1 hypothetical protein D479_08746 [Halobacillus sp. BAB-2008]